jgi:myo-inositol-1-phosphate synthase
VNGAPAGGNGPLGIMLAGLDAMATTFIGGVLLLRKGVLRPAASATQMDAGWLASDARVQGGKLDALIGLASLDELVFGAWSIYPDRAVEVAQLWSLFEPEQLNAIAGELAEIAPAKGVFDAREVTDGSSATYIKLEDTKAGLADALESDIGAFENQHGCRTVVLFCGAPEAVKKPSAAHASPTSFEAGLKSNDPDITSSQIYSWTCAKRGTPFACAVENQAIGFPAVEEMARSTGAPLAGNGLRPASYRVLDIVSPSVHAPNAEPPCWWPEPLRPEMDAERLDPKARAAIVQDRENLPIEMFKRTAPALLDLALLLDGARRRGWGGTQHWLDILFSAPSSPRSPEQEVSGFRDTLIRMLKEPSTGAKRI